jgi:NAD(P)-dependent dehydrogenase (short-subunit alcohol dehydrogenase family)
VNAAGIYPCDPILEMTKEAWDRVLDVNLKGMFLVSQQCCRRLAAHRLAGAIVNITLGAAERARVGAGIAVRRRPARRR